MNFKMTHDFDSKYCKTFDLEITNVTTDWILTALESKNIFSYI